MIDWEKFVGWFCNKIDGTSDNDEEAIGKLKVIEREKIKKLRRST